MPSSQVVAPVIELAVRVTDEDAEVLDTFDVAEVDKAGDIMATSIILTAPEAVHALVPMTALAC